jgi:hypothetical protein
LGKSNIYANRLGRDHDGLQLEMTLTQLGCALFDGLKLATVGRTLRELLPPAV